MVHVLAKELREAVLQAAMSGNLTEQLSTDTPVEETLKQIAKEKDRLIKEKKIKKNKPLPEIDEDEVPFDIPENWIFVNLGEVITLLSGQDLPPTSYNSSNDGIPYITGASNFVNGNITINRWTTHPRSIATKGSLLLTCKGTIGETAFLSVDEAHIARQVMSISPISTNERYILHYLHFRIEELKKKAKSMIPGIERKDVLTSTFPLPPIEEQARIVAKVDELMAKIDEYEKLENKLVHLKEQFSKDMKDSLLQAGMMGKLTEQLSTDTPVEETLKQIAKEKDKLIKEKKIKKDKSLPEIDEDDVPLEIPESWSWVRFGFVSTYASSKEKVNAKNIIPETWILDLEDIEKGGKLLAKKRAFQKKAVGDKTCFCKGDILYSKLRPYLRKILIADEEGVCTTELVPFQMYGGINSAYVLIFLKSPNVDKLINQVTYGIKMPRVGTETMQMLCMPLPPIEEQARIVAKLDQILPLVESLEVS